MGEISAALCGRIRVVTSLDLTRLLLELSCAQEVEANHLAEYVCELALLQSDFGVFPIAEVASGCVLLSHILRNNPNPWPKKLQMFTGFSLKDLNPVTRLLHAKCFTEPAVIDHRDVSLQAVYLRYSEDEFSNVSHNFQCLSLESLNE